MSRRPTWTQLGSEPVRLPDALVAALEIKAAASRRLETHLDACSWCASGRLDCREADRLLARWDDARQAAQRIASRQLIRLDVERERRRPAAQTAPDEPYGLRALAVASVVGSVVSGAYLTLLRWLGG